MGHSPKIRSALFSLTLGIFIPVSVLALAERFVSVSDPKVRQHVEFLGDDELEGRGTGTEGARLAASYIADRLEQYKLKPLGDEGYFQMIPMRASHPLDSSSLQLFVGENEYELELNSDYLLYRMGAQTFIPQPIELVFVGYGIVAPEFDYNDYQDINVENKVVVFLEGEPDSTSASYFSGSSPSIYSYPEAKQRCALSRGARGSILIPDTDHSWQFWQREFAFEHVTLAYGAVTNLSLLMNRQTAEKLFEKSPFSLSEVRAMKQEGRLKSFEMSSRLAFHGEFRQREFLGRNVVGLLEGGDPELKDSYLLISAHYDHLGRGPAFEGDSIYNGVFDNALGVAATLEIARMLIQLEERPSRSVLFLFTTGEEKGLLGSRYYVEHPVVPLFRTVANINIDGVASLEKFRDVIGIGAELSTLGEELRRFNRRHGMRLSLLPTSLAHSEAFVRSDQLAFAEAGIPSVLILDGLDLENFSRTEVLLRLRQWEAEIYHSPKDDLSQKINYKAVAQHVGYLFEFCLQLADSDEVPHWYSGVPYVHARLQSEAEKR